jgi:hypothetical protein
LIKNYDMKICCNRLALKHLFLIRLPTKVDAKMCKALYTWIDESRCATILNEL